MGTAIAVGAIAIHHDSSVWEMDMEGEMDVRERFGWREKCVEKGASS
jgi:hypothetical protein